MIKFVSAASALSAYAYVSNPKNATQHMSLTEALTPTRHAICILYPDMGSSVSGLVSFSQENMTAPCKIVANVKGLKSNGSHAFHIHQFGDLTEGCHSAGPHYNPFNKNHGGPLDSERHVGDLGNLQADGKGNAYLAISDPFVKLFGETSVLGRSCVVHSDPDDFGKGGHADSLTTGHAGNRLACGVIGLAQSFKNLPPPKQT